MINIISITTAIASTKKALVVGSIDDGVIISRDSLKLDESLLTVPQSTSFNDFMTNVIGTDKNVSIINLPYNSDFSIDYITDSATFTDANTEYDYTLLSDTTQAYIDNFNQLMVDLLP
jgi:hypothetical protein